MKGYFWANLKGTIVNWEVLRFRLFRNTRPMDITWELALEEGAVDEILLIVPFGSSQVVLVAMKDAGGDWGSGDPLKTGRPKYPEAFLTVTDGRRLKGAKFRLTGISFEQARYLGRGSGPEDEPYARGKSSGTKGSQAAADVNQVLVSLDKVERVRAALPGK